MQDTKHIMDDNGLYVLATKGQDLAVVDGLETSMLVSLFTNARMDESQRSDPLRRSGWIGNIQTAREKRQLGGLCWTLENAVITTSYLGKLKEASRRCHDWMLDDKITRHVVSVTSSVGRSVSVGISYTGRDGKAYDTIYLWKNTNAFTNTADFNA